MSRRSSCRVALTGMLALVVLAQAAGAADTVLVRNGSPQAYIVVPAGGHELERLAARELQLHIQKMSGATLPIVNELAQAKGVRIAIGSADPGSDFEKIMAGGDDPASFRVLVKPNVVHLTGRSEQGTLFAAYEMLEQLGVRWFIPDEIGTVIPKARTVAVRRQDTVQHPGFSGRILGLDKGGMKGDEWFRRMRMGGFNCGSHGYGFKADPNKEPELFMTEDGRATGKLRISHPEVLRRTIAAARALIKRHPNLKYLNIGPEDGDGFGEDPWDAGDIDPLHGKVSITDRLIKFQNLILEDLQKDYPDIGIGFYCYSLHMRPPVRETPNPKILPILAPIDVCRFHAIDNPVCWERQYIDEIIKGWKKLGLPMMYRGYLFNLADQGMPFAMIRQVRSEFPFYHRHGMIACRVEGHPAWSYQGPAFYLAARIMWDPKLDADATLNEYFTMFYGPAASAMRAHFDRLEDAYEKADFHTGNTVDIPRILTPDVIVGMETTLENAERAVSADSIYGRRIHMTRVGFEFGKSTLRMMAALNAFEFADAKRHLDRIKGELLPVALEHEPPILNRRYGPGFTDRFWTGTVESAYERISGGNEIVVRLPDEWQFILDPHDGGEKLGLWRPEIGTGAWRPLKTYSRSWSGQGLRYYKSVCWYRTAARVPQRYLGRKTRLWLGGVDDTARAWINGKELPLMSAGSAPIGRPWEFDASDAIAIGKSNTIVVRVSNRQVNELGTGGLTAPAMIWAEKEQ